MRRARSKLASNAFLAKSCENDACWELPRPLDHHIVMAARFVKTLVERQVPAHLIAGYMPSAGGSKISKGLHMKGHETSRNPHKKDS